MWKWIRFILQVVFLYLLNELGYFIVDLINVPIPGNVVGLLLLFILLLTGIVKVEWIKEATSFFTKHLAFFFIPIGVSLMGYGDILLSNMFAFLVALLGSLAFGFFVTGKVSQLSVRREEKKHGNDAVN